MKKVVLGFVIIVIALLFWIKVGIHIDKLTIGPYKLSGLYIKLDKKLVLTAHDIHIPVSKSSPSLSSIDRTFDRLRGLLGLLQFVALQNMIYKNNKIDFIYADNYLHINTKDYEIVGKLERKKKRFVGEVPLLYLKKQKLTLRGKFTYSHYEDRLHSWGRFELHGIKGKFVANKIKDKVNFDLQSDTFGDLKPFAMRLPLKDAIKAWPAKRVKAKEYRVLFLKGGGQIQGDTFKPDFEALKGELELKGVRIDFKDGVEPVMADQVNMQYRNGGLYFTLEHPTYQNKNIEGSKLSILELIGGNKPTVLKLDLKIDAPYDEGIQNIIKAYKLNIPILQKKGDAKANVLLDVILKNGSTTAKIDVDLQDALVHIYKLDFAVKKGTIHYEDGIVTLNQVVLSDKIYSGVLNGKVDIKAEKAKLLMDAEYIRINKGNEKFFALKDKKLDINLDYTEGMRIHIPQLSFNLLENKDKKLEIKVDDLSRIKPFVNHKGFIQEGGSIEVATNDLKKFNFEGILYRNNCFFYEKNGICHTRVPVRGVITPNNIEAYAFNKRLYYNEKKGRVTLDRLNVDLENMINYRDMQLSEGMSKEVLKRSFVIIGKHSDLRYQKFTLKTDSYDVEIKPNGNIKAIGSTEGDIVKFEKRGKHISINALRIKDKTLHPLINFGGLKNGRYSLKQTGRFDQEMKGRIIIEGGVMKNFKVYNNTIALINTIPALAVLQDPGFSSQGYEIENGVAEYRMIKDEKIIFDSIYIKGKASSVAGEGYIDLKQKTINIKLAIQTVKDFGKVIGNIPLLGYILLGEDKSMTIGLKVKGSLDKPKITTSAAADVLSLPLRIIKRTLEVPKQITK